MTMVMEPAFTHTAFPPTHAPPPYSPTRGGQRVEIPVTHLGPSPTPTLVQNSVTSAGDSPTQRVESAAEPPQATEAPSGPCAQTIHGQVGDAAVPSDQTTPAQIGTPADKVPTQEGQSSAAPESQEQQHSGQKAENESHLTLRDEYVDRVWEEFVTDFLLGSCHIQKAAIFDLATRRPLAVSGNLHISTEEMDELASGLQYINLAYRNGVTLGGRTYKVRLADGRNGILARTGLEGCTVCKTISLIIIGVHDNRGNSRKCNEDVMRLGDFFRRKAL